jgi:hypothetical protein
LKKVLFLAYYFPPLGGAGVQRSVKFVQYLPGFGYDPIIVTGPTETSLSWAPADYTLADALPAGADIRRVPGPEPPRTAGWQGRVERWLGLSGAFARWWIEGTVSAGRQTGQEVDVICASMSPFASGEAAMRLARELARPWVADLRDPWALDEWVTYPTAFHRGLELGRMRRVLASADAVVMNTPGAAEQVLRRFPELRAKLITTIPNGFDASDFEGPPPVRDDGVFRIVHTGYVHTDLGLRHRKTRLVKRLLGGAAEGLNVLARSHLYLLDAVAQLIAARPELRSCVELHLAGVMSKSDREVIRSEIVRAYGYLPHDEAVALIRSADLLFLPMHDLAPGIRASIVPGKTYEYLASGRPILAAVPDGDARDLLEAAGTAFLCRPIDIDCMQRIIHEQIERCRSGRAGPAVSPEIVQRYERRRLVEELAVVFDAVIGTPRLARPCSTFLRNVHRR